MSARVAVAKLHGARNDFILVDGRVAQLEDPIAFARAACDRHTGIGADGLLVVGRSSVGDLSMRVINADGSEAEMCGNGVRCVACYADGRGDGGALRVETLAGIIHTDVVERGREYRVRVNMGTPRIVPVEIGIADAVVVDTGNPHAVLFRLALDDVDLRMLGERMQAHAAFAHGVNVHVAVVENERTLRVRHFERGVGLTMACGTGAVACTVAAIARGAVQSPATVHVPGGELTIAWDGAGDAYMTGPAMHVFTTDIDPHEFNRP